MSLISPVLMFTPFSAENIFRLGGLSQCGQEPLSLSQHHSKPGHHPMLTLYLPPKAVRAAGQLQSIPSTASLKDNLGMFKKKKEKKLLFCCC